MGTPVAEDDLPDSLRGKAVPDDDLPEAPKEKPAENEARRTGIKPVADLRKQGFLAGEKAAAQNIGSMAEGAVRQVAGGLRGLGHVASDVPAMVRGEKPFQQSMAEGAGLVQATTDPSKQFIKPTAEGERVLAPVGQAFDYMRGKTGEGAAALRDVAAKAPPAFPMASAVAKATTPEAARTAGEAGFDVATQAAPLAKGLGVKAPAPKLSHVQDSLLKLKQDGYAVPPNVTNPSLTQQAAAAVADPDALLRKVRQTNAANDTRLATKDLGLPEGTFLNEEALQKVREQHTPAYDAIRKLKDVNLQPDAGLRRAVAGVDKLSQELGANYPGLKKNRPLEQLRAIILQPAGTVTPGAVLDLISELRTRAKALKSGANSLEERRAAGSVRNLATEMENFLERKLTEEYWVGGEPTKVGATTGRELAKVGDAGTAPMSTLKRVDNTARQKLIDNWRSARQALAKLNDVEEVVNTKTSNIDSAELSRMRKAGTKLSGGLEKIADAYDTMENISSSGIHASDVSRGRAAWQAAKSVLGGAGAGFAAGGPVGAAAGAVGGLIMPAAVRNAMVSKLYQQLATNPSPSLLARLQQIDPKAAAAWTAAQAGRQNSQLPEAQK